MSIEELIASGYSPKEIIKKGEFKNNQDWIMEYILAGGNINILEFANSEITTDSNFMKSVMRIEPGAVFYSSPSLKKDEDFVTFAVAVMGVGNFFSDIDPELMKNKDFVISLFRDKHECDYEKAIQNSPISRYSIMPSDIWKSLDKSLLKDLDVAKAIIEYDPIILFNYPSLRKDRDFILEMVKRAPCVTHYMARKFRKDKEIMLTAMAHCTKFEHVDFEFDSTTLADPEFQKQLQEASMASMKVSENRPMDLFANTEVSNNTILIDAIQELRKNPKLRKDPNFLMGFMRENYDGVSQPITFSTGKIDILNYMDSSLRENKDLMLSVIRIDPNAVRYLSPALKKDLLFMQQVHKVTEDVYRVSSGELYTEEMQEKPSTGIKESHSNNETELDSLVKRSKELEKQLADITKELEEIRSQMNKLDPNQPKKGREH